MSRRSPWGCTVSSVLAVFFVNKGKNSLLVYPHSDLQYTKQKLAKQGTNCSEQKLRDFKSPFHSSIFFQNFPSEVWFVH